MSKHFELMQQLEKEQPFDSASNAAPSIAFESTRARSAGQRRWADDEALRIVQQIFVQVQKAPHVVVFAGVDHGNGCSQICASVAETLAKNSSQRVCLVEANFRSPALSEIFGTTNHHGLTEALLQKGPISSYAKPVAQENFWLLSSGTLAVDSPSLLSTDLLRARMLELREEFEYVIIDAPPLTRYSDAAVLGQLSDGLVMVLEAESTRREAASVAAASLRSAKVEILAAVLNKRTFPIPGEIYNRL